MHAVAEFSAMVPFADSQTVTAFLLFLTPDLCVHNRFTLSFNVTNNVR